MAGVSAPAQRSSLVRVTPEASALLLLAAAVWVAVIWVATSMGSMPGTMGLGIGPFVGVWALMMAAMMLPAVAPVAAAYSRSFRERRPVRLIVFACGYLLAWASSGLIAYAAALLVDRLTGISTTTARVVAAVALLGFAGYQLHSAQADVPGSLPLAAVATVALRSIPRSLARPARAMSRRITARAQRLSVSAGRPASTHTTDTACRAARACSRHRR